MLAIRYFHSNDAAMTYGKRSGGLQLFSRSRVVWFKIFCVKDSIAAKHCKLKVKRMHVAEKVGHATMAGDRVTGREVGAMAGVRSGSCWRSEHG